MFDDREDGALQLAEKLKPLSLRAPLVLAIPRGGVVTGATIAHALDADLDVVLAHKLRAPHQPELGVGAVGEDGEAIFNRAAIAAAHAGEQNLEIERRRQLAEIERRRKPFRTGRPAVPIRDRTVILTDDGITTGSTMLAAMDAVNAKGPQELIVAVPVGPPDRLLALRNRCDRVICLIAPPTFSAVGEFYRRLEPVSDETVMTLLRQFSPADRA